MRAGDQPVGRVQDRVAFDGRLGSAHRFRPAWRFVRGATPEQPAEAQEKYGARTRDRSINHDSLFLPGTRQPPEQPWVSNRDYHGCTLVVTSGLVPSARKVMLWFRHRTFRRELDGVRGARSPRR